MIEYSALNHLCRGSELESMGAALSEEFPDADVVNEFGILIARWLDDELLADDRV